jgi:hypothetical protein
MLYRYIVNKVREIEKFEASAFMGKLSEGSSAECAHLVSTVTSVAKQAADVLKTVVRDMPLYTLHDERHVLNVIGWMESLLQPNTIAEGLSHFECALCILAAYTHDLVE